MPLRRYEFDETFEVQAAYKHWEPVSRRAHKPIFAPTVDTRQEPSAEREKLTRLRKAEE